MQSWLLADEIEFSIGEVPFKSRDNFRRLMSRDAYAEVSAFFPMMLLISSVAVGKGGGGVDFAFDPVRSAVVTLAREIVSPHVYVKRYLVPADKMTRFF